MSLTAAPTRGIATTALGLLASGFEKLLEAGERSLLSRSPRYRDGVNHPQNLCHPRGVGGRTAVVEAIRVGAVASSESVRSRMSRQRRRDAQAEMSVRQLLHARGVRYRVDARPEPDLRFKVDIVWRWLRLVVFIDGCFWHVCSDHATTPRANGDSWARKLAEKRSERPSNRFRFGRARVDGPSLLGA